MVKTLVAVIAGIITALAFVALMNIQHIDYPNWLPYLVGYISMESDLIKFDNLMGEAYNKIFKGKVKNDF